MFERSVVAVKQYFARVGLGHVFAGVQRISVVRTESYHDVRNRTIGLNPADARRPFSAMRSRHYLLIHELGHHFAEVWLTRAERRSVASLFGNYDAPYRRAPKPKRADSHHVSRYSMTHPAEDFAETFAVCLWSDWEPAAVRHLLCGKSRLCARKIAAVRRLVRAHSRGRNRAGTASFPPAVRGRIIDT